MFRGSSSRWVNLCSSSSSWTHAWTLNSCTIVSPRYEKGGEACIQPLFQWSWPWRTEIRDKRHEKRRTDVCCPPFPFPPSLDSRTIRRGGGRPIYRFDLPDTYTRGLLQPVDGGGPPLLITNGCNESFAPPSMGLFILGREVNNYSSPSNRSNIFRNHILLLNRSKVNLERLKTEASKYSINA